MRFWGHIYGLFSLWIAIGIIIKPVSMSSIHSRDELKTSKNFTCLGEYQLCADSQSCVLNSQDCNLCKAEQYLCPRIISSGDADTARVTCVNSPQDILFCPALTGTHYDHRSSFSERVAYLVSHTSPAQKISQLQNKAPALYNVSVPSYNWLDDGIHGITRMAHETSYPDGCGLGATWDRNMLALVGRSLAIEARAKHNVEVHKGERGRQQGITYYTPNMNLVRNPKWGRNQEVYSEDPYLTSELAYQFVNSLQNGPDHSYVLVGGCLKHFAAYDVEDLPNGTNRFQFDALVNRRNFWETYVPHFRKLVRDTKTQCFMCSYNSINSIPTCGDPKLLNGLLREKFGFEGFVVSDYDAVKNLYATHHYAQNYTQAAAIGQNAGCDQEGGGDVYHLLNDAVREGKVSEATINQAFSRLMMARMELGMFDPPTLVEYNHLDAGDVQSPQHLRWARLAAQESITLYKNKKNVLPLDVREIKTNKVAVIGPQAPDSWLLLGNYHGYPTKIVSVLQGLNHAIGFQAPQIEGKCEVEEDVEYALQTQQTSVAAVSEQDCCNQCANYFGCKYWTYFNGTCGFRWNELGKKASPGKTSGKCSNGVQSPVFTFASGCESPQCQSTALFPEAVKAAQGADLTIVLLGLDQLIEAEMHDRRSIDLPGNQAQLVSLIRKAIGDKPLIGILIHGGSMALGSALNDLDAILDAWYPGMEGGNAIADVIFGFYNPGAKTAVTWYQNDEQLPPMENMDLYAKNGTTYRYFTGDVQFPFGYGLSYTTFEYENLMAPTSANACDSITVSVQVTNSGPVPGDEVIQVYVKKKGTVPSPKIRLAGFERIHLKNGESQRVTFTILPEWHSVVMDGDSNQIYSAELMVQSGQLEIYVGGGQPDHFPGHRWAQVSILTTDRLENCPSYRI